jgi:hypothetical protein
VSTYVLLTEETRRARKLYLCVHCAERIEPGDLHVYVVGTYDGCISGDRWHPECRFACNERFDWFDWLAWEPGCHERGSTEVCVPSTV